MKTPIDLFCGAPLEIESEIAFLDHLISSLEKWGDPVLICANFLTERNPHQIDFLVIAPRCVCHVELKTLTAPVVGQRNGSWSLCLPGGQRKVLEGKNPYRQALDTKYALSDAIHNFAVRKPGIPRPPDGQRFYKFFETVVCVHPRLLPGSQVPSDHCVYVMDTGKLLDFLRTRDRTPGWSREQWLDFILHLGLERRQSEEPGARTARELMTVLSDYRRRCESSLRQALPGLVPTTVSGPDGLVSTETLRDFLSRREHVQLVGPSGSGKSHFARHLALTELEAGGLVILISAREFDDRLSSLLNRSVAHLHPGAATEILEAAQKTGTRLSLILDGVNECPVRLRKRLFRDLQSLVLRWPLPVLITTREPVEMTPELQGVVYQFPPLAPKEREAVLRAYAPVGIGEEALRLCDVFGTSYELSLAAIVLGELSQPAHRSGLLDAYIRHRCDQTSQPITARLLLVALARRMHEQIKSSLTQLELWQVAEPLCAHYAARPQLVGELIDGELLESRRGRVSFRHELLERLLQAESLVRTSASGHDLTKQLRRPVCRPLVPLALGLLTEVEAARRVLQAMTDGNLLADCIRNECGPIAREAALAECEEALQSSFRSLDGLELHLEMIKSGDRETPNVTGGIDYEPAVRAGLHAVGLVLSEGLFLDQALALARETDEACRSALESKGVRPTLPVLHAIYYQFLVFTLHSECPTLPAALVFQGTGAVRFTAAPQTLTDQLERLAGTLGERSPGELFLLCNFLKFIPDAMPQLIPELLRVCWKTGLYHLKIDVLQLVEWSEGVLQGSMRDEVENILRSLPSRNPFLNTAIMDALIRYDLVESPVTPEQAVQELSEILESPDSPEACQTAYHAVANQLEEIISEAYSAAFGALTTLDQECLLARAVLGAPEYSSSTDWILGKLVRIAGPASLPALRHWAVVPRPNAFSSQEATRCFLTALAGCARLLDRPPDFGTLTTDDEAAWAAYGEMLFWLIQPGLTEEDRQTHCRPLWERLLTNLAFQAVDPLSRFASARLFPREDEAYALATLARVFPDEVRRVMTFGLRNHTRLTSLFSYPPHDGYLGFLIAWLRRLGNQDAVSLLEAFLESPEVGQTAAEALRAIRSR